MTVCVSVGKVGLNQSIGSYLVGAFCDYFDCYSGEEHFILYCFQVLLDVGLEGFDGVGLGFQYGDKVN